MIRRIGMAVAILAVLAGCGSSAPQVSDPKQIVTQAIQSVQNVKTVHLDASVTGSVPFSMTGQAGASMKLDGTTLAGDLDVAGKKAHMTITIPPLMGMTVEVIQVDTDSYIKASLLGQKWMKSSATSLLGGLASAAPAASAMTVDQVIGKITEFLNKPGVTTTKLADEQVGGKDCYHVQVTVPANEIQSAIASAAPLPSLGVSATGNVPVDVWVEKSTMHPLKLTASVDASGSTVGISMTMSNYDAAVTISAPPADQIQEGGGSLFGG